MNKNKFDVLTIGTATVDVFIRNDFKTISDFRYLSLLGFKTGKAQCFSLGSKIEIEEPFISIGGGAFNAAVTFARHGFKTATLFNIGDDYWGKLILQNTKKEKITPLVIVDKKRSSGQSFILLNKTGERTVLVSRGCSGQITLKEIPYDKLFASWVYVASGSIPFPVIERILSLLKKRGAKIALNPSKDMLEKGIRRLRKIFNWCQVVFLNREEASYLTGINYLKTKEIFKKLDESVSGVAVMTDGEKGAYVSDGKILYQAGVFKEKRVVDRTGAGDAFGSGFVAGLLEWEKKNFFSKDKNYKKNGFDQKQISYALKKASANATSVIEHLGANQGILTAKDFSHQKRWKNLKILIKKLK